MDLGTKNANNLISKNQETAKAAAHAIIENSDVETFEKLCEKSEFIFDFLKEKIIKNLCCAVNRENIPNIFKFTKIYSLDFENFIINSWLKFANEDLTDEILALFETGDDGQKAYAAAYFSQINDPVALEYLEKYAFSDFEPLAQNCAIALSKFNDKNLYNKAVCALQEEKNDIESDFEKCKYINFLVSYGDKSAFDVLFQYFKKTCTKSFTASNILYLTSFFELVNLGKTPQALEIFDTITGAYPEEVSLETVFDFEISEFVKYLCSLLNPDIETSLHEAEDQNISPSYIRRIILKAKHKFNLISREDIYTFDLSKDAKKEVSNISGFLNTVEINLFDGLEEELLSTNKDRVLECFDVILNFGKKEFSGKIAETVLNTEFEDVISEGTKILKNFGRLNLINKEEILNKINNAPLKALTESYF